MKNKIIFGIFVLMFLIVGVSAVDELNVCCEKTNSGLYCQNVPLSQCTDININARKVPTACSSTSYCRPGTCYNSFDGTCLDGTPQIVCNKNNGTWSDAKPASCELGCCILGDQASFVSLVRCKRLASMLGVTINYRQDIKDEVSCILTAKSKEKGACVYQKDFETTCKMTTRDECTTSGLGSSGTGTLAGTGASGMKFWSGKLCSAAELNTTCGPTKETTCIPGKDEVYFLDSCGNPANIYDYNKIDNPRYWSDIIDKSSSEICGKDSANANSADCGNCNYALGSYCRKESGASRGQYICASLNCQASKMSDGVERKHGESWCSDDVGSGKDKGKDAIGSEYYRHICVNGEEIIEPCAFFRQEECISGSITMANGKSFSQAACRVNRWKDCIAQQKIDDCENTDQRDCIWKNGTRLAGATNTSSSGSILNPDKGVCLPKNPPGLKFWEGDEAKSICAVGNAQCIVTFEKGLISTEAKCKTNCQCLEQSWVDEKANICYSLGDCGPNKNFLGKEGSKKNWELAIKNFKEKETK